MSTVRNGNWMQTYSGQQFWPIDPIPGEIDIIDIAASLSKMCRYAGHCLKFYSVAEHCVLIARQLPPEFKLWGLLHDASEAYLVDIPRPIKPSLSNYMHLEEQLMKAVADRFYLRWPMPAQVHEFDNRILLDEQAQNMSPPPAPWNIPGEPLGIKLQFWSPNEAFDAFMHEFKGATS